MNTKDLVDIEGFARKYFESSDVNPDALLPRIEIKYRDKLCFKGKRLDYEDFTKFVKVDNSWTPLIALREVPEDAPVADFTGLVNVGVAEFLTLMSQDDIALDLFFLDALFEAEFADSWYDAVDKLGDFFALDITKNEGDCILLEGLRSSLIDYNFPAIRRIYSALGALRVVNPKSYCKALIEAMFLSYTAFALFAHRDFQMTGGPDDPDERERFKDRIKRLTRHGAIEYTVPGTNRTRHITDCRGLGICTLMLLTTDIFSRFGDFNGTCELIEISNGKFREYITEMFDRCVGDDFIGRYMSSGRCRPLMRDKEMGIIGNEANLLAYDCSGVVQKGVVDLGRGLYEAQVLWKYAVGAKEIDTVGSYGAMDCSYGCRTSIINACMGFVFSGRGIRMTMNAKDVKMRDVAGYIIEHMSAQRAEAACAELCGITIKEENKEAKSVESLQARIAELETALSQAESQREESERLVHDRQLELDQLREEVRSLRGKVRSMYSECEVEDSESSENECAEQSVSTDEMLSFVNQFRLVIVGGHNTLSTRLEAAGFTNFYVVSSERASNATLASGDFFCLCTKFISHKLAYNVETYHADQLDRFFYFNGTNVDMLLRICYEFMTNWFKSSEGGDTDET